jgi:F0F1-type ATP synthase delta subunit
MKKNRQLSNLINQAVLSSFESEQLNENKVLSFIKTFKSLPKSDAIFAMGEYYKGIKRELGKTTLEIESATPLSSIQVNELVAALKSDYKINSVKSTVNPDLIGGVRVKIADTVFDDSLVNRIDQLRDRISA